jgi:hypothetical protein
VRLAITIPRDDRKVCYSHTLHYFYLASVLSGKGWGGPGAEHHPPAPTTQRPCSAIFFHLSCYGLSRSLLGGFDQSMSTVLFRFRLDAAFCFLSVIYFFIFLFFSLIGGVGPEGGTFIVLKEFFSVLGA